jgi:ATP-dependent Clp protease ATP-binding subunit ClpB
LIDELLPACALKSTHCRRIDVVEREIMQLEIERQALQREEDTRSKNRLKEIEQRIADLKKSSGMKAKWQSEKEIVSTSARPRPRWNS